MNTYEVTMLCIGMESSEDSLNSLSERIDVMFLIGNKFTTEEYLKLADAVSKKISDVTSTVPDVTEDQNGKDETV